MNEIQRLMTGAGLFAMLVSASLPAAVAEPGMPLADALNELRNEGLAIVYSSDLVTVDMRVERSPVAATPREQLDELLVPWALRVQPGPDSTLLIVRSRSEPIATGRLAGQVRDATDGLPLAGAEVVLGNNRYMTVTDDAGNFVFNNLAPGRYRIRVHYATVSYVRRARAEVRPGETLSVELEMDGLNTEALDEIIVSTSRYKFGRSSVPGVAEFTAADLEILPNVGDDPLRALSVLPGSSTTDFSARANLRGGGVDENLIRMDGFRLYNAYHFKDFQGLFSAVDPRLVGHMDVYTGGFAVDNGDVMSGVIDVQTVQPEEDLYGEVSVSFFNLSGLVAQQFNEGDSSWLLSARRGNLDWVVQTLDPKLGNPNYYDVYGRLSHSFSDELAVTASAMLIDDNIDIADSEEEEYAQDNYRDNYYWLRFDFAPDDDWSGNLLLSRATLNTSRGGTVDKEGATSGALTAMNDFTFSAVESNWSWWFADDWLLQFGGEYRAQAGNYNFQDDASLALLFQTPGAPTDPNPQNDRSTSATGAYISLYTNMRMRWTDRLTTELGLRWNKETLSPANDSSIDPRFGLMYEFTSFTRGRFSVGRYSQSQTVDQLDFADGELDYAPLEHVDQVVVSLEHDFPVGVTGRIEAYYKDYADLRPRYENFLDSYTLLPQLWPDRVEIFADEATAEGLELTLSKSDSGPLGWWLTYAWSQVEDRYAAGNILRSWDQRNAIGAGLDWRIPEWEFSIAARLHEGWPTTATGLDAEGPPALIATGTRNAERLGTYFSLDARVAHIWQLTDRNRLTVFLEVRNLTNRKNDCCVLYEFSDETGTDDYTTDVATQIPIIPSLGFIWQF